MPNTALRCALSTYYQKSKKPPKELRETYGAQIVTYVGDVSNKDHMKEAAKKAKEAFGEVNVTFATLGFVACSI